MNRSSLAFTFSAERLLEETGELYLWTFTFREVPESDDWALAQWASLVKNGKRDWAKIHGLRVIELHRSHGVHFHCLLNQRFPVERVYALAWPLGFGRINVKRVENPAVVIKYLAKYLFKQYRNQHFFGRRRRWGSMGGFSATRCKDIEYDTAFHRNKRLFYGSRRIIGGFKMVSFLAALSNYGDFEAWPERVQAAWLRRFREMVPGVRRNDSGVERIL